MVSRITQEREIEIAGLYDRGMSIKSIMAALGHGQRVVTRAITTHSTMRPPTTARTFTEKFSLLDATTAYWVGFIAADGHLRADGHRYELVIEVNRKDQEHLDGLKRFLGFGTKVFRTRDQCIIYIFSSKSLVENLSQWVPVGNKTTHDNFSKIPTEWRKDFVRGYFDGDGSTTGRQFNITSCAATLIPLSTYIGQQVGKMPRIYQKPNNLALSAHWNKAETLKFFELFDGTPRLERKWNK